MKSILIYYAASMFSTASTVAIPQGEEDVEGTANELHTFAELKEATAKIRAAGKNSVMLRDATLFDGLPENDILGVIVLGDVANADAIAEAYETVEVKTVVVDNIPDLTANLPEEADKPNESEQSMSDLKSRATELGVNFPQNIGEERLKAKIAEAELALENADDESEAE